MAEHVLVTLPFLPDQLTLIQQQHPSWTFTLLVLPVDETLIPAERLKDVTILYTFNAAPAALADAPKLKWISVWNAGLNAHIHNPFFTHAAIPWTTSNGVSAPQIAELVVAAEAAHRRNLHALAPRTTWPDRAVRLTFFNTPSSIGRRVGIFGYGAIGRHVARLLAAHGSTIVAFTASPRPTPASRADDSPTLPGMGDPDGALPAEWHAGTSRAALHAFLAADLDWLVVCAPLTPATRGALGAPEFALLANRRAYVTNVARGELIDTPALVAALSPGADGAPSALCGAHLDVTDPEPLDDASELWRLDNVLVTPHCAALVTDFARRAVALFGEQCARFERGERLVNLVSRANGY